MENLNAKVVQYISAVQPKLEKNAAEKKKFLDTLTAKVHSLNKLGALSKAEAEDIIKEAENDISAVFKFLDIPQVKRIGTPFKSTPNHIDPITSFINS